MYDATAAFEAFFKPVDGGYIYYRHRFARGISVTQAEHDRMIERNRRLNEGGMLALFVLLMVLGIAAIGIIIYVVLPHTMPVAILSGLALAFLVAAPTWYLGHFVRKPIRGRKPDHPRRDGREFDIAIGRSWGKFGWFWACFPLVFVPLNAHNFERVGIVPSALLVLVFAFSFVFWARVMVRTWRADRADKR